MSKRLGRLGRVGSRVGERRGRERQGSGWMYPCFSIVETVSLEFLRAAAAAAVVVVRWLWWFSVDIGERQEVWI